MVLCCFLFVFPLVTRSHQEELSGPDGGSVMEDIGWNLEGYELFPCAWFRARLFFLFSVLLCRDFIPNNVSFDISSVSVRRVRVVSRRGIFLCYCYFYFCIPMMGSSKSSKVAKRP